jgi:serine/threonine-protein kinase
VTTGDPFGLCGQVLDGQFRVDRVIGEGGFSVVYRGQHIGLDEPIAIKCLKLPGALGSAVVESFVRRFRDESKIHYKLSQGNLHIARSIASGTTMAPVTSALVPYMVLEWLEGKSLAQDFTDRRAQGLRGRTLAEAVKLMDSAVDALAYAHAKGVVHRDINPGNLFLTQSRDGMKLKVLDFGVAKVVSDHALEMGPRAPTLGHIRIFSPAYASPEQFDDKIGKIGPWTDVYAVTLVLLEMMRDKTVNEGEHLGEFAMRTLGEVRPTPRALGVAVGDEVEALLSRAVSLSTTERPQDAGELWGMLKHAIRKDAESGQPAHAHRPETVSPAVERVRQATSNAPRAGASTVRMESAPPRPMTPSFVPSQTSRMAHATSDDRPPTTLRTGSAALAGTPTPPPPQAAISSMPPAYTPSQAPAQSQSQSQPARPMQTPLPGSMAPGPGGVWLHPSSRPPPAYGPPPVTRQVQPEDTIPRSRGPAIAITLVVIAVLVAATIGVVLFVLPHRH